MKFCKEGEGEGITESGTEKRRRKLFEERFNVYVRFINELKRLFYGKHF